jgi:predicted amidohydrolase
LAAHGTLFGAKHGGTGSRPRRRFSGEHRSRRKILIAGGLLEDAGNLCSTHTCSLDPDGLLGTWRKMHVPMYEMPFYNGGDVPRVVDTPVGRVGVNICFDALLPESTRLLAVQNVEIVLFPFAADPPPCTPEGWRHGPSRCSAVR